MSPYAVEFTASAARDIRKLDPPIRRRILDAIERLADEPRPSGCKKLAGFDEAWRVRIGDYRVLYEVSDGIVLVTVFKVGHRRAVYEDR